MQLPVDVKALLDEATNIKAAQATPLSVSVYIDDAAPADLVAYVRNAFASSLPSVRMTVTYLDDTFAPRPADDVAIVAAGASSKVGACAAAIRLTGVPVMVVTTSPVAVNRFAEENGWPIPDGDVVGPDLGEDASEPIAIDDAAADVLNERMGRWLVSVCHEKRLALSIAFPLIRRPLANDAVSATSMQNACVGLAPFIPGADLPVMTLNQLKMVLQIAAAYGHEMDKEHVKELVAVVGGAYLSRTLARELIEFVPVLGFAIRTGVAYASTAAMGHAIIEYYEGGEDVNGVANIITKAGETGAKAVTRVCEIAADPSSISFDRVTDAVAVVRDKAEQYVPRAIELASEYAPVVCDKAKAIVDVIVSK